MSKYKNQLNSLVSKYQKGGILNKDNFDKDWYGSYTDVPNFPYRDVPSTANRWQYLSDLYGQDTSGFDLKTQEGLNKLAGALQKKGLNNYNSVANDYAMNMAPTRDGLRNLIENGVFSSNELKSMGVKMDSNNLPTLGVDETKISVEDKGKLVKAIQTKLDSGDYNKFKNSYVSTNFNDDKAYHRFFEMRDVGFDNQDELDAFSKERGFDILDNDKGIYKTDKTGAYVRLFLNDKAKETPATPETPQQTTTQTKTKTDGSYDNEQTNYTNLLPVLTPDQSNLAPKYFGTRLRGVRAPWNVANFVSPESSIREINRQTNTARETLSATNPYTSASAIANLQAQENQNIANATYQTEMANQQAQNQTDAINEQRVMNTDLANNQEAFGYENRSNIGLDNYYKEWINYTDRKNKERIVNYNLQNQVNAVNAVNPNYNIGMFGQIYQTPEEFKIFAGANGEKYMIGKDGVVQKITTETKSGNTKTKTETKTTKKVGGLINDSNLKEFLGKFKKG